MKNYLLALLVVIWVSSCAVVPPPYSISETIMKSHNEVMTENYPTKKSVFVKYGTPMRKETFENIENWYYKLSELTSSTSIGFSSGVGRIYQDPLNPYLRPQDRALNSTVNQVNSQKVNSSTVETYVQFWFVNDTVSKWETYGVNYSYPIPNPKYNRNIASTNFTEREKAEKHNKTLTFLGLMGVIGGWLALLPK
jgi:hypothetical protein